MNDILKSCTLCPRECKVNRYEHKGFCGETAKVRIARAELHMWEEPCISGTEGSGTVFFSGCCLKCCFCQNYEISAQSKGFELTEQELADTFLRLQSMGANNINLVNPTHFVPQIIKALDLCKGKLIIPVVYNSGGYEKPQTLELLRGFVQIFLPDLKYFDPTLSDKYSKAADYFENAAASIHKMAELSGKPTFDEKGIMQSGTIVRHLVLPTHRKDSIKLMEWLGENFAKDEIMISLMSQFTPVYKAFDYKELCRKTSTFEYNTVIDAVNKYGFEGFVQSRTSAAKDFIPEFYDEKYY